MRGPDISEVELENQRDVVKNEIRVNVLNRPYGTFPWLDVQEHAFDNWQNSHNGYGDMVDLDSATLEDAQDFFDRYYSPKNAVLCVAGDFEEAAALKSIDTYFSDIPAMNPPERPDIAEERQVSERVHSKVDPLASRPALALAYRTPERGSKDYYALGLLNGILTVGDDSLLRKELVRKKGFTSSVSGSMNFLGHMHNAETPLLLTISLIHDDKVDPDSIIMEIDQIINSISSSPINEDLLIRAKTKIRSGLYGLLSGSGYPRFGVSDLLCSFELLEGDASLASSIPERFEAIEIDDLRRVAEEYLVPSNRTVIKLVAGAK